jgi:hypothetical protein
MKILSKAFLLVSLMAYQAAAGVVTFNAKTAELVTFERVVDGRVVTDTAYAGQFIVDGRTPAYCVDLDHWNGFENTYRQTQADLSTHQFAGQRYSDAGNRIAFLLETSPTETVSQSVALQIAIWTCCDATFRVTAINGQSVHLSTLQFIGYDPRHQYRGGLLLATHVGDRYQDLAYAATPEPTPATSLCGAAVCVLLFSLRRKRKA